MPLRLQLQPLLLAACLFPLACFPSDELEAEFADKEACSSDDECLPTQECVRTDLETATNLPGVCREEGSGCMEGRQLGCVCDFRSSAEGTCSVNTHYSVVNVTFTMECDTAGSMLCISPDL